MKKYIYCFILVLLVGGLAFSLTAEEILKKVNDNLNFTTSIITAKMEIYLPNQPPRIKVFKAWIVGQKKAYVEFLNKEDKNIRYLKVGKNLWIYDKIENNTFLISEHLLRQGMMGSDVSYEDILESSDIHRLYSATLEGEEKIDSRDCYVLLLRAKVESTSYGIRKMWVDKETFLPLREERYALSGKLLKVSEIKDIKHYGDRAYPTKSIVSDKLKVDTKTVITVEDANFDINIPDSFFTRRYLER
ncbi:MAG: outer membrane lipoprotein-sorting protein [Brevinematia bacterium]